MRKSIFFSLIILVSVQLVAQKPFKRSMLYGEILGNGLVLSVNYERQLQETPGLGLFIGIGLGGIKPAIPFGAKYLINLGNKKSFLETGVGITLAERDLWDNDDHITDDQNSYRAGFIPSVGYRHHTSYGFMWRVNYTPVFSSYRNFLWLCGVSVGWRI